MQATVTRAAVVGLTILGLAGCQNGGGWSWPQWRSAKNSQPYPSTADAPAAAAAGSYFGQGGAPNVELPSAKATPYNAAGQSATAHQQPAAQPPNYAAYSETATGYSSNTGYSTVYPNTTASAYNASTPSSGLESANGYANPAASSYRGYQGAATGATAAVAPQEGYYGAGSGASTAATQAPSYNNNYNGQNYNAGSSAGSYPSTAGSMSPYSATARSGGGSSYSMPDTSAPTPPADYYATGGALRTADNRAATGTRYDGGVSTATTGGTPPLAAGSYQPSAAAGASSMSDRYSQYESSAPPPSDSTWGQSSYPNSAAGGSGASSYPTTAPAVGYPPATSAPVTTPDGASGAAPYRPGGTKDYIPTSSSGGSAIPSSYGSSSAGVRPADYVSTAGDSAAAAAKIPAVADRYSGAASDDRYGYGSAPAAVTPPNISIPAVGQ